MKKIFFVVTLLMVALGGLSAQDVIMTKEPKRVKAKVLEIKTDELKYYLYEDKDSVVHSMPIKEVTLILYENGKVQFFEEGKEVQEQVYGNVYVEEPVIVQKLYDYKPKTIVRHGFVFVDDQNNKYGRKAFLSILKDDESDAYKIWKNGTGAISLGWTTLGVGVMLDILGGVYNQKHYAVGFYVAGTLFEVIGIPSLVIGYRKQKKAIEAYNIKNRNREEISLNFGVADNGGVGVVMKF